MGIEPTSSAWEAEILPLNYTRVPVRLKVNTDPLFSNRPARRSTSSYDSGKRQLVFVSETNLSRRSVRRFTHHDCIFYIIGITTKYKHPSSTEKR